ncbi:MAG: acylphosphatase [Phycisphaerae bacterium]|nr:acylphosphatase [Phycisphaerae bacterium]
MAPERRDIWFSGTVQGVGFRYTACRVAGRHDVTGYVRNLPDGRVECIVEGEHGEIDDFVTDLSEAMRGYIRDRDEQHGTAEGQFSGFGVRR